MKMLLFSLKLILSQGLALDPVGPIPTIHAGLFKVQKFFNQKICLLSGFKKSETTKYFA